MHTTKSGYRYIQVNRKTTKKRKKTKAKTQTNWLATIGAGLGGLAAGGAAGYFGHDLIQNTLNKVQGFIYDKTGLFGPGKQQDNINIPVNLPGPFDPMLGPTPAELAAAGSIAGGPGAVSSGVVEGKTWDPLDYLLSPEAIYAQGQVNILQTLNPNLTNDQIASIQGDTPWVLPIENASIGPSGQPVTNPMDWLAGG